MQIATKRLVTFLIGPAMAALVAAISLAVVTLAPIDKFIEIQRDCAIVGLSEPNCVSGAYAAGIATLAAFALVIAAIFWAARRFDTSAVAPLSLSPVLLKLFLAGCFAVVTLHLALREIGPAYGSRIEELYHFSAFTSIESLLWPILVQFFLIEKDRRLRIAVVALLLLIITLTPYRTASFTIFVFVFLLPLWFSLAKAFQTSWSRSALTVFARQAAFVLLLGCALLWNWTLDSETRALSANPQIARSHQQDFALIELSTVDRIWQRLAIPLYQAAIVEHLAATTSSLPTIVDEFKRKFRLSKKPNVNEFVYQLINGGEQSLGEVDSLYQGEGAAYFGRAGPAWALCAPLLFVVAWFLLSRMGLEVSAVLGVQLWRSSFAGLITILPALVLQLAAIFGMAQFGRAERAGWLKAPGLGRFAAGLPLVTVGVAAAIQVWAAIDSPQRRDTMRIEFATAAGCEFNMDTIEGLAQRADNAVAVPGLEFRSSPTLYTLAKVYLVVPYGSILREHLPEFVQAASHFTNCKDAGDTPGAEISGLTTVSGLGFVPLYAITLGATIMVLLAGLPLARRFLPASA